MLIYVALLLGCVLLYKGGDWLLAGLVDIGDTLGWPKAITGLILVSLGTSAPELFVSIGSAIQGLGAIAAGNVVGSNIINIALVLGIATTLSKMDIDRGIKHQLYSLVAITFISAFILANEHVSRLEGAILIALIITSFIYAYWFAGTASIDIASEPSMDDDEELATAPSTQPYKMYLLALAGLLTLLVGAELMIWSGTELAIRFNVPTAVIALTVTSLGTSLPEIAATVIAVIRRDTALAIGNVVGSNLLNLGLVLGLSALIEPLSQIQIDLYSIFYMIGLTLFIFVLAVSIKRIPRAAGLSLLASYVAYVLFLTH